MFKKESCKEEQNFWISYADLMAGLLFVFILVVGAIVVRYVYVQQDLEKKRRALGLTAQALETKNKKLQELHAALRQSSEALAAEKTRSEALRQKLTLSAGEVAKLKALLLDEEEREKGLQSEIGMLQHDLNSTAEVLAARSERVATLEENLSRAQSMVQMQRHRADMLEQNLTSLQHVMLLKEDEIAALGKKLLAQSAARQQLVEELNITKAKIKNLTGIRIRVVNRLREKLGDSIEIDPKSGALRFASNILFDEGAYRLKPGARKALKAILQKYIRTLLQDEEIRNYIDGITIEGHTNTSGSYLYNLALSQKRALEVMKFLYESDPANRALYSRYLSASGRSYADLIYDENGNEDKEASRRIEIKFRIKNEKAVKELEKFLEHRE